MILMKFIQKKENYWKNLQITEKFSPQINAAAFIRVYEIHIEPLRKSVKTQIQAAAFKRYKTVATIL